MYHPKTYKERDAVVVLAADGGQIKGQATAGADPAQAAAQAALVHAVGTADGTVDDVGGAFNQTTLNNNFKELTTRLEAMRVALRNAGIIAQ